MIENCIEIANKEDELCSGLMHPAASMCGDLQVIRRVTTSPAIQGRAKRVEVESKSPEPKAVAAAKSSSQPQASTSSKAKRAPSPSKIAPALALQRAQVLAKIRVRRPHLHRRHRPTTAATMPKEVQQKSGIAIGLNKGHVRPPRNPPPHAIRER